MGRSRKKHSGGGEKGLTDQELRRYVLLLCIPCVVILLVIAVLAAGKLNALNGGTQEGAGDSHSATAANTAMPVIEPDTKQYFMDFGGSILSKDTIPEINWLMEQYFHSITQCDMDTFLHLFTSQDTSEESRFAEEFEHQRQYVDGYQNISCYTVPGLKDGSYAVYVYYEIRYTGVETPAPSLVQIYAVKCEDGQYRIYDQAQSQELEDFLEQLSHNEDVRLLISQVDQKTEEAMEADPALKERIEYMKNGPDYMQGE